MDFAHLHVHTQYSILDGAAPISSLFARAKEYGQKAIAITDHGNMFGVKEFLNTSSKYPEVKPIVGCEVYVALEGRSVKKGKEDMGDRHLILLAKNKDGYKSLVKLASYAYIEGFYYRPRIDRELLAQYHEGLICSSACLSGEIPKLLLQDRVEEAEEVILWYKNLFGEDYYLEVQRHRTTNPLSDQTLNEKQDKINNYIFQLAEKHGIKVIATNDVHFVDASDAEAHDRLICINTASDYNSVNRLRYSQQEYLKSTEEMMELFSDHPEVISNTMEIVDKVEQYSIDSPPIMPHFPIPEEFADSDDYLRHLTLEGAKRRYGTPTQECLDRINFELETVKKMGFPDYFLIVQDYICAARDMGVIVGPGRGSAAGSVVAYCLTITDIDPLKYDLLFERFLNPDRISMPDIDVDFDDDGRYKVYRYVEDKYGKDHVSHVITFGTMAAKSAIRDVGRVVGLPLNITDSYAKLVPGSITTDEPDPKDPSKKKELKGTIKNCIKYIDDFKQALEGENELLSDTIKYAAQLEGSIRQVGVHACAVLIGREDLTNLVPISISKDKDSGEDIWVSQYEGSLIESIGLLKMDFLGLRTLTIIKETLNNIKNSKGIDLNIDTIPIDDKETYQLFGRGDTISVFQFESDGMSKWLRALNPTRFEDLIAMNALYRPGPMAYIPDFVDRKNGRKQIEYDLPQMADTLHDTYGITVYQEQVMLLSQRLAGFTPGQADTLRKAMGKKQITVMEKLYEIFIKGGVANGHPEDILNKIWGDWKKFAEYAFNKSHATCYAWVGYQTGYLKAHHPAEFLAANLSCNLNDIKEITKIMAECKRMGIKVLGPDINESLTNFTVNKKGNIRFGLGGVKGVGSGVVDAIISVREKGGLFKDIFDFVERCQGAKINRKVMESLIYAGALDSFEELNREQYFVKVSSEEIFLDALLKYAVKIQNNSFNSSMSLFGDMEEVKPTRPALPPKVDVNTAELLKKEKELVGMYLSSHPLDKFSVEFEAIKATQLSSLNDIARSLNSEEKYQNKDFYAMGLVVDVQVGSTKNNKPFARFEIEDFSGSSTFTLFGKDYEKYLPYLTPQQTIFIKCSSQAKYMPKSSEGEEKRAEFELKVKGMVLLANAIDEFVKEVVVDIPVEMIDANFRKEFKREIKKSKGNALLVLKIRDSKTGLGADFFSKKHQVKPTVELLEFFRKYKLHYDFVIKIQL